MWTCVCFRIKGRGLISLEEELRKKREKYDILGEGG